MAAFELLAKGNTPAASPDFEVVIANPSTLILKGVGGPCAVNVDIKDDEGGWTTVYQMTDQLQQRLALLAAPGIYRANRISGYCGVSCV